MNIDELGELLLVSLYDQAEALGNNYFLFSLNEIASSLGIEDMQQVAEAAFSLESTGYLLLSHDVGGALNGFITTEGCLFVESGGKTGIIKEYIDYKKTLQGGSNLPVADPVAEIAQDTLPQTTIEATIQDILAKINDAIALDGTLEKITRDDLLGDVETLTIQVAKTKVNKLIIESTLKSLSQFPTLQPLTEELFLCITKLIWYRDIQ
jgi:hypothetical protein